MRPQAATALALAMIAGTPVAATTLCLGPGGNPVACQQAGLFIDGNEFRTIDGSGNNRFNPDWGAAGQDFLRLTAPTGNDEGIARGEGPSARDVSNATARAPGGETRNASGVSNMFWAWGQFLDHDITRTGEAPEAGQMNMGGGPGDPQFPNDMTIDRSTRSDAGQQTNQITAYIDASMVYGSDDATATTLRANDGSGRLRLDENGWLPQDETGAFLAGDVRANEQQQLISMQTLFAREHNRVADTLGADNPGWSGERIYQEARSVVGAEIQAITYNEWLPRLLGERDVGAYQGYDPTVNAGISNEFATCAFRFCHSMIPDELERLAENGDPIAQGHLQLRDGFFNPQEFRDSGGLEPLIRGLASQQAMEVDPSLADGVRNFLNLGEAENSDLLARNIARGRDHGIGDYNDLRAGMGFAIIDDWGAMTDDPVLLAELVALYGETPDGLDPYLGLLMEDHVEGGMVGETNAAIIADQFDRLRAGDRFWYEGVFAGSMLDWINGRSLADIILDNTGINWIQNDVFAAVTRGVIGAPGGLALVVFGFWALRRRRSSVKGD